MTTTMMLLVSFLAAVSSMKPLAKEHVSGGAFSSLLEQKSELMSFKEFVGAQTGEIDPGTILNEYGLYKTAHAAKNAQNQVGTSSEDAEDDEEDYEEDYDVNCGGLEEVFFEHGNSDKQGCRGKETQGECESRFIRSDGDCYRCVFRVEGNFRGGSKCGIGSKNKRKSFARRKCGTCPAPTPPVVCAGLTEAIFQDGNNDAQGCRGRETKDECESFFIRDGGSCYRCVYRVDGNFRSGSKCGIGNDNDPSLPFARTPCSDGCPA